MKRLLLTGVAMLAAASLSACNFQLGSPPQQGQSGAANSGASAPAAPAQPAPQPAQGGHTLTIIWQVCPESGRSRLTSANWRWRRWFQPWMPVGDDSLMQVIVAVLPVVEDRGTLR